MEQHTHGTETTPQTATHAAETSSSQRPAHTPVKQPSFWGEFFRFSIIALIIVLPIRLFIAQPFIVSGASMEDTFATGEYLIIDQVTYALSDPSRGDVIVFHYPRDHSKFFIKRVIGLPGDTVTITDGSVTVSNREHPDGVTLTEPYIDSMRIDAPTDVALGNDEYFVMGDNRDHSSDSRVWGVLNREEIVGRAYIRLFPLHSAAFLPGAYDLDSEVNE